MPRKKKRNLIPIVVGVLALLLVAAIALRFSPGTASRMMSAVLPPPSSTSTPAASASQEINPDLLPQAGAVVGSVAGAVTVTRASSTLAAFPRMKLLGGDAISVPKDGSLTVVWPNYGRSEFAGGTSFTLVQAFESTDALRFLVRITLDSGRTWSRLERAIGPYSGFSVRSGNVLVATPGASFGIAVSGSSATVQSLESYVDVYRVSDQPTTLIDRENGVNSDTVEVPQGDVRELSSRQEVTLSTDGTDMPKATAMSDGEQADPFAVAGNAEATADDLSLTPLATPASSTAPGA